MSTATEKPESLMVYTAQRIMHVMIRTVKFLPEPLVAFLESLHQQKISAVQYIRHWELWIDHYHVTTEIT